MKTTLYILFLLFYNIIILKAEVTETKQKLKSNMTIQYRVSPQEVDNIDALFSKGIFYGRLRSNTFVYNNNSDNGKDYTISGFGATLMYRSAYLNGFGFATGFYTTQNLFRMGQSRIEGYKGAKDTFSRYKVASSGDYGIDILAQAFMEYKYDKNRIKIGRQIFESFLTKSNDTKMIPNTFEGMTMSSSQLASTKLKLAFLTKQKLRDHSKFHHILAYGDNPNDPYSGWSENDDGAMHRGLTLRRLDEKNIDDKLFIFDFKNSSIKNSTTKINYTALPQLLSYFMIEEIYRLHFDNFMIIPSFRFMKQFDDGAGDIAGANLKNKISGYKDANSLDANLFASKIDIVRDVWSVRFGYSHVADKADIVAPWRGFPTSGYTRAMGQTNWYANTTAYMFRADYNFNKPNIKMMMRYVIQDFDDNKIGVQSDSRVLTFDVLKKGFSLFPTLYVKLRASHVEGNSKTITLDKRVKPDSSYNELRLEFNYFF